jgi:hypothetical protein
VVTACGKSSERQQIINFMNDSTNSEVMKRATAVDDDWNTLTLNAQQYTSSQFISQLGNLEQRAAQSYTELSKIVPPKCLRGFWDKEVEASKLSYQAFSLMYRVKDDPNITQDQINDLFFKSNDLKTEAQRVFQDLCDKNNIEIPW